MSASLPAPSPGWGTLVRHALAGLLVALLAALTPVVSAAPAGAARPTNRAPSAASTTATAPASSTGEQGHRGLRAVAVRSAAPTGRRLAGHAGAPQHAQRQRGGSMHPPAGPGTGSADPAGPPSSYVVTIVRPNCHALGGHHHLAAAGRAPPSSCGS